MQAGEVGFYRPIERAATVKLCLWALGLRWHPLACALTSCSVPLIPPGADQDQHPPVARQNRQWARPGAGVSVPAVPAAAVAHTDTGV